MDLRPIEQACGCSSVRGGCKLCACLVGTRTGCLPDGGFHHLPLCFALQEHLQPIEQACGCSSVRGGCKLFACLRPCAVASSVASLSFRPTCLPHPQGRHHGGGCGERSNHLMIHVDLAPRLSEALLDCISNASSLQQRWRRRTRWSSSWGGGGGGEG